MRRLAERIVEQQGRSRLALMSVLLPLGAFTLAGATESTLRLIYVVLGFSLIIFLHELGHFVVARSCSVKCLAFSIGIGPRMLGWRKGVGLTFGADPYDPEAKAAKAAKEAGKESIVEHVEAVTTHSDMPTSAVDPAQGKVVIKHEGNHTVAEDVGVCDYRVSWLPLGGYVRMLGQDDMDPTKISMDPRAFNQRPVWQRMCIVSAGVIMNLIFAAVAFSIIFSPGIGVDFPPAQLGQVELNSPAWNAGLRMGDRIISINGEKPEGFLEFTDVMIASALSSGKEPIHYDYLPYGSSTMKTVEITPIRNSGTGFLAIGADSIPSTKLVGSGEDYAKVTPATPTSTALSKVRSGDAIVAVDGKSIRDDYIALYDAVQAKNGKPVTVTLENTKDKSLPSLEIELTPRLEPRIGAKGLAAILGLAPQTVVGEPQRWSAAASANFKDGDVILRVGDRSSPTVDQFIDIVSNSAGKELTIVVARDHAQKTLLATPRNKDGKGVLGLPVSQDAESLSYNITEEGDTAGIPAAGTIAAIDGTKVESWLDVYSAVRQADPSKKVAVTFKTDKGDVIVPLTLSSEESEALRGRTHFQLGIQLINRTETQVAKNTGGAVVMGMQHTKKFILQVYMTLAGLFRGTVSPSNLHGIVGITKVGYEAQERGPVWLWYILALVSVNLAVANFLPLPIVDGGLFLLLILEKIRGKPLSLKVQSAIQIVGIVILAGMFLFVTFNDIQLFR